MGGSLGCEMLAATEADLQPDRPGVAEQRCRIEHATALGQAEAQCRQELVQSTPSAGTQTRPLSAAEEEALRRARSCGRGFVRHGARVRPWLRPLAGPRIS